MHVIADIVGIPEADRPEVFRLTEVIMRAADPLQGVSTGKDRDDAQVALFTYAHRLSAEKRSNPTDDVWSILAAGELDEFELDLFFMVLTFAGSETTRNALSQGLMALARTTRAAPGSSAGFGPAADAPSRRSCGGRAR